MKLTVLGSGTCIPSPIRNAPGYLLQVNGRRILVDCGSGVSRQLVKAGHACSALDCIFLTHFHPDHCSDLVAIVQALKIGGFGNHTERLIIGGPPAIGEFYRSVVGEWLGPVAFTIKLLDMQRPVVFEEIQIQTVPTTHLENGSSLAYSFTFNGRKIIFSGDAAYSEDLVRHAVAADLLVADCSSLEKDKRAGHMSARECGILARRAEAKSILLSHIYPAEYADQERIEECRREFAGTVMLAEDLKEHSIP
jgi:ribonuclease BN (tRNA processing enzyme)